MPELIDHIKKRLKKEDFLSYETFIHEALYHPNYGYYCTRRNRIGQHRDRDFYTASALQPTFSNLLVHAFEQLVAPEPISNFHLVELGAENGHSIFEQHAHRFKSLIPVRIHDPVVIPSPAIVFSNELLDAQPFRRFLFKEGCWHEKIVILDESQHFAEGLRLIGKAMPDEIPLITPVLPVYHLDWPSGASNLLSGLLQLPWKGLFITFDYGLSKEILLDERALGTARTYSHQKMGHDLLKHPGQQDITCHICWDEVERILLKHSFSGPQLERQEAFFLHHATEYLQRIVSEIDAFSPEKRQLMELLHPHYFGEKFQVMWANRL
jgi:SAM-dependent MidA family methyltransferase